MEFYFVHIRVFSNWQQIISSLEFKPLGALEGTVVLSVEQGVDSCGGENGTLVLVQTTRYMDWYISSP